jgi:broad specificity phosphatase PhoE
MKIYLLRHAVTSDNELGVLASRTDTPLSEKGKKQALVLIGELKNNIYDIFFVSPLQRTLQTIQRYLDTLDNPIIITDARTIERDLGIFTKTHRGDGVVKKHRKKYYGGDTIYWIPLGGESIRDVFKRAQDFFQWLCRNHYDKRILICGHQVFLRCSELIILDRPIEDFYTQDPPRLENATMRSYEYTC